MTLERLSARKGWSLACFVLVTLAGCVSSPSSDSLSSSGPVFYPPAPNPPRIQFLTSMSGAADIDPKATSFAKYVVGDDAQDPSQLVKPYGVAFHAGKLYAVDTRGGGYAIFDLENQQYRTVRGMTKPINITIDKDGNKWITDTVLNRIFVFDRHDRQTRMYGTTGQFKPGDVAIIGNRVFVTDLDQNQIKVLDKGTGKITYTIGSVGARPGQLMFPTNLAVDKNENLFVSDTGNFRISKFKSEGPYLGKIGEVGNALGSFARPKGIALDKDERLYVVDAAFQNVQVFDASTGQLLMFFGGGGVGPGELYLPVDISIDYGGAQHFQKYAAPGFVLEYVIFVTNQFGPNKINVYGFGKMKGADL